LSSLSTSTFVDDLEEHAAIRKIKKKQL